jgi:hypothetical protein
MAPYQHEAIRTGIPCIPIHLQRVDAVAYGRTQQRMTDRIVRQTLPVLTFVAVQWLIQDDLNTADDDWDALRQRSYALSTPVVPPYARALWHG